MLKNWLRRLLGRDYIPTVKDVENFDFDRDFDKAIKKRAPLRTRYRKPTP